ncbi:MAG: type IV pilus assembly protein PilM [Phycisphaeraceae bacterium]|nr:MAG: type IV pilus assembly protein PilM [Phycisphaeraceae bacterium]
MASSNVCWGIEIGAGAIKALKLSRDGADVKVEDFAVVPHSKVLSTPDIDQADALRVALGTLAAQHDLSKASIVISAPGHAAFVRFAKLPPVEPKKVPDIVKFEAVQQIPFPIEEVEWDFQTFISKETPDIEVGIFAITRERVMERLNLCADVNLQPDALNISPVSVYNAIAYDQSFTEETPGTVIIDVGTLATDLIVAEGGRVWIRTFPLGGHHFTEALVNSFKLPYSKAEKLKREADRSQHKRHVFQAMRPVFADLAQDVQRSLSYYQQLHPNTDLKRVIGVGSTFRLMGLRKFLSQQLQMDVVRLDKLGRATAEGTKASDLQSVTLNMATAYGLALQGVGLGAINANLVPTAVIRESVWKRKTPWFAAAAAIALVAGGVSFYRPMTDRAQVEQTRSGEATQQIRQARTQGQTLVSAWREVEQQANFGFKAENIRRLVDRRDVHAHLMKDISSLLAASDPQPELVMGRPNDIPLEEWRLFRLHELQVRYLTPSGELPSGPIAEPGARDDRRPGGTRRRGGGGGGMLGGGQSMGGGMDGMVDSREQRRGGDNGAAAPRQTPYGSLFINLVVESPNADKQAFVDAHLLRWLRENAERDDAPYTLTVPTVDQVRVEEIVIGETTSGAAGRRESAAGPDRQRGQSSNEETTAAPGELTQLAPLPPSPTALPQGATIYRYTLTLQATLKAPGEHRRADAADAADAADEAADDPSQSQAAAWEDNR